MSVNKIFQRLLFVLTSAASLLMGSASANAMVRGVWRHHPGFSRNSYIANENIPNHTVKIMDGPRMTYFLVHQNPYVNGTTYGVASTPTLTLFRVDNTLPQSPDKPAVVTGVSTLPGVSGLRVSRAEYFPSKGVLAVVYDNRYIDLIFDDGEIANIPDLADLALLNLTPAVETISFDIDGKYAYLAGNFGFLRIDIDQRKADRLVESAGGLLSVNRVGEMLVASNTDGLTYCSPLEEGLKSYSAFRPMEMDLTQSSPTVESGADKVSAGNALHVSEGTLRAGRELFPLSEGRFATFHRVDATSATDLLIVERMDNGKWRYCVPRRMWHPYESAYWAYSTPYDGVRYLSETGLVCHNNTHVLLLNDRTVAPDFSLVTPDNSYPNASHNYFDRNISQLKLENNLGSDNKETFIAPSNVGQRLGSYNHEDYWFYAPHHGWIRRHYDAQTQSWRNLTSYTLPNAPEIALTSSMGYIPGYGIGTRICGQTIGVDYAGVRHGDLLSVYKNGEWTNVSVSDSRGAAVGKTLYGYNGVVPDPMNPRYVFAGSRGNGFMRIDMEDPENLVILSADCPGTAISAQKTYIPAFPNEEKWKGFCYVTPPSFDAKGNMWFLYDSFSEKETNLGVWSRENITASGDLTSDPSRFKPIKMKTFPMGTSHAGNLLVACRHPKNEGILIGLGGNIGNSWFFFDTKGQTDLDKVEMKKIVSPRTDNGGRLYTTDITSIVEDPFSGRVWFCFKEGIGWFDPAEIMKGNEVFHRVNVSKTLGSDAASAPFRSMLGLSLCVDEHGHIWIGTKGSGVYCLSNDGSELLGQFDATNSLLESGEVYAMDWNPESHSLMVSTPEGLLEFISFESDRLSRPEDVRIWPRTVAPDFNGYLSVSGVPSGIRLSVVNGDGEELLKLPGAVEGMVQWDLRDNSGRRLPTGRYSIVAGDSEQVGDFIIY